MKVSKAHLATMRHAINVPANADMRTRWDAMWEAIDNGRMTWNLIREYNDDHIDTALRQLSKETP